MILILASGSPRRADLLRAAGIPFIVRVAGVGEAVMPGETPVDHVRRLADAKATAVAEADRAARGAAGGPGRASLVLGADTVVVVDGRILGKPRDGREAAAMLRRLSGRSHEVVTGVALVGSGSRDVAVETTRVWLAPLDADDIAWYVASGEPRDKAGAYAIQGLASRWVTRIDGSYTNVVGLPVARVVEILARAGFPALVGG